MAYLSPEIEAKSRQEDSNSLVRPGVSCGIFQDCNATNKPQLSASQLKTKSKSKSKTK